MLTGAHVPLVEDLALADLAWVDVPPPVAAHAPDASIAVVGSLSKLFWGGLRLGFVRVPEALALRFARIKATQDLGTSAISSPIATVLLADALHRSLPDWKWRPPHGGLSMWIDIGQPSEPFAQHALRHGVAVATPSALSASNDHDTFLRLSFASPRDTLQEGVNRLVEAWRTRSPHY